MLAQASQLVQLRPTPTVAQVAYSASVETEVTLIVICNTTGSSASFSIHHDDDGSTFDADTVLYNAEPIPGNTTRVIELKHAGGGISVAPGGSIAVTSSVANALNFTLYGVTTRITGQI